MKGFLMSFLNFLFVLHFPRYLILFHGLFKIYRDCEVHTECGTVLLADQNARIFLWLEITNYQF